MKPKEFRKLSSVLKELTPHQRQILIDRLQPTAQASAPTQLVETLIAEKAVCPHCAHEQVSRWGFANGLQRYRCNACRATFNALAETPLAGLGTKRNGSPTHSSWSMERASAKVPLRWVFIPTRHSAGVTAS